MADDHQLVQLGEIADVYIGMLINSAQMEDAETGVPVITPMAIRNLTINTDEFQAAEVWDQKLDSYMVQSGDVLLPARSTSIKFGIVPDWDFATAIISSTLIGIRPDRNTIHPRVLVGWLSSPAGMSALESVSQSGTHQMSITSKGLKQLVIPIIPMDEQHKLIDLMEAADQAHWNAVRAADERREIATQAVVNKLTGKTK